MRTAFFAPVLAAFFCLFGTAMPAQNYPDLEKYVAEKLPFAIAHAQPRGIPIAICLGQAIVESAYGNSKLATAGNNHFGMKKGGSWQASVVMHADDEFGLDGKIKQSKFRAYRSVEDSFLDYAENLKRLSCYRPLFSIPKTDYRRWARGLQRCGYASSPKYAQLLIAVIELGGLQRFDFIEKKDGWSHHPWAHWSVDFPSDEPKKRKNSKKPAGPDPSETGDLVACLFGGNEREFGF